MALGLRRRSLRRQSLAARYGLGGASDKQWDFFISHTQRSGHATTLAAELHADLTKAGYTCWLDVKMEDRSEAGMREGVMKCKVVLAIITGDCVNPDRPQDPPASNAYFSRQFCILELLWAREGGTPIQPVIRSADKHRIGDFLSAAPEELRDIGNTDFITLDRSDRDYWLAGIEKIAKAAANAVAARLEGAPSTEHPFSNDDDDEDDDVALIDVSDGGVAMVDFGGGGGGGGMGGDDEGDYDDDLDDTDHASAALLGRTRF